MSKPISLLTLSISNWPVLFWIIHTLTLVFFLLLEGSGFRMPVGSSIFWFGWMAVWMTHGLALLLGRARAHERDEGDPDGAERRFRRRMGLGVHSALFLALGPAVMIWWLVARQPGPQQPGEGQGFWIYPLWLILLLAHSAYVVTRERRSKPAVSASKHKGTPVYHLTEDGELEGLDDDEIVYEREAKQQQNR